MPTPQHGPETWVQIRRIFAAPPATVFEAWTKPEQLEKWMCRDTPQLEWLLRHAGAVCVECRVIGRSGDRVNKEQGAICSRLPSLLEFTCYRTKVQGDRVIW